MAAASKQDEVFPVVLQSPKKGLELVFDQGETEYQPSGGWRVKRKPSGLSFDRGVCSVSRERWESLGFKTREDLLAALHKFQRAGAEFVIREELERVAGGRSSASTPPLVVPNSQ